MPHLVKRIKKYKRFLFSVAIAVLAFVVGVPLFNGSQIANAANPVINGIPGGVSTSDGQRLSTDSANPSLLYLSPGETTLDIALPNIPGVTWKINYYDGNGEVDFNGTIDTANGYEFTIIAYKNGQILWCGFGRFPLEDCPCPNLQIDGRRLGGFAKNQAVNRLVLDRKETSIDFTFLDPAKYEGGRWQYRLNKDPLTDVINLDAMMGSFTVGGLSVNSNDMVVIEYQIPIPDTDPTEYETVCEWRIYVIRSGSISTPYNDTSGTMDSTKYAEMSSGCDDSETDPECECPCPCDETTYDSNGKSSTGSGNEGSMDLHFPLLVSPNEPGLKMGYLKIYRSHLRESNPVTPKDLYFASVPTMQILADGLPSSEGFLNAAATSSGGVTVIDTPASPDEDDVCLQFKIQQASGFSITFDVMPGESVGWPIGQAVHSQTRIVLLDASMQETAVFKDCRFVRQYRTGGGYVDYDRVTKQALRWVSRSGRVTTLPDKVEIIRSATGEIEQVKTEAGLMNIVLGSSPSDFTVSTYDFWQVGAKVNGKYTFSGNPRVTNRVDATVPKSVSHTRTFGTRSELVKYEWTASTRDFDGAGETATETDPGQIWVRTRYDANGNVVVIKKREVVDSIGSTISSDYFNKNIDSYMVDSRKVTRTTTIPSEQEPEIYKSVSNRTRKAWDLEITSTEIYETSLRTNAPITRTRTFYEDELKPGSYGRIKSHTLSRGITRTYVYDDITGHLLSTTEAYLDDLSGKVITYDYTPHVSQDTLDPGDFRPRTTTVTLNGIVVSRNFFAAFFDSNTGEYTVISELAHDQSAGFGDAANLRATSVYHAPNAAPSLAGRLKKTVTVDNVVTLYDYAEGSGVSDLTVTATGNLDSAENPVDGYSVRLTSTLDARGLFRSNASAAYAIDRTNGDVAAWSDVAQVTQDYDANGYPITKTEIDPITGRQRILEECDWTNGQKTSVTDEIGVVTTYAYDELYRVTNITRSAIPATADYEAQDAISTSVTGTTYAPDGSSFGWMDSTVAVTAGGITLTSERERDYRGRVNYMRNENGYETTASYNLTGTVATVTVPNTGTVTATYFLDGRLKSQVGTAMVDCFYDYTVHQDGRQDVVKSFLSENDPRHVSCTSNMLGQTISCNSPAFNGASVTSTTAYETGTGRMLSSSSTAANIPDSIVEYNSIGVPIRTGISTDNATLTPASSDRIVDVETGFEKDASGIWTFSRTYVYPQDGSATRKLIGTSRSKATGFSGLDVAAAESVDIAGNMSTGGATLDRNSGITQITSNEPGVASDSIATSYYGRLETTKTPGEANLALVDYDPLGRVRRTKNPRHAAYSTVIYEANKTLVASTSNANGDTSSYAYYANGNIGAGSVSQVTLPDGTTQHTTYTLLGRVASQWGSQMYPRSYEYDAYDQLVKLNTWKANPASYPLDPASSDASTTWNYEAATGLLLNKRYADNKGTDYTYDTAGRLLTKTLARLNGSGARIQSSYGYTAFGELQSTTYNDGLTKSISNLYDRLGRKTHNIQGTTVGAPARVTTYSFDAATLLQTAERFRDGIYVNDLAANYLQTGSVTFDKTLNTGYDALLRVNAINVPGVSGNEYSLGYTYGVEGRLTSITDTVLGKNFGYNYNPNSRNLIDELTSPIHKVANQYEANRGVLLSKTNSTNTSAANGVETISKFAYTVNSIGQRTKNILSGKAIVDNGLANTTLTWDYTYTARGELATAAASSDSNAVATLTRNFAFDAIGNFTSITDNNGTKTYVSDALNRYNSITTTPTGGSATVENKNHDEDGNTTQDATKRYVFDAEDRLVTVTDLNQVELVSYRYDSSSRRIERSVPSGETRQFLYNEWNVITEYTEVSGNWELAITRTWGLDVSGTEQGAGGIGGLLAENQISGATTDSYYPLYDGNGNVTEYLDSTGAIVAHYEYDPFGKINLSNGSKAGDFTYLFSTKPVDAVTGFHYYGYRWYDSENGRWINRDPIKENGGLNVYGFCGGDPVNYIDVLGGIKKKMMKLLIDEIGEEAAKEVAARLAIRNSYSKLRRIMKKMKDIKGCYQLHHVIPQAFRGCKKYNDFFDEILFNVDAMKNVVRLPTKKGAEKLAAQGKNLKTAVHQGKHNKLYDEIVEKGLDDIMKAYAKTGNKQMARTSISKLQKELIKKLKNGDIILNKAGLVEQYMIYTITGIVETGSILSIYLQEMDTYHKELTEYCETMKPWVELISEIESEYSQYTLTDEDSLGDYWYAHTLEFFSPVGMIADLMMMVTIHEMTKDMPNIKPPVMPGSSTGGSSSEIQIKPLMPGQLPDNVPGGGRLAPLGPDKFY